MTKDGIRLRIRIDHDIIHIHMNFLMIRVKKQIASCRRQLTEFKRVQRATICPRLYRRWVNPVQSLFISRIIYRRISQKKGADCKRHHNDQ